MINQLAEVNPNLIVSLHAGGGVRMSPWIDRVKAVVHLLYPGQAGGRAFAEMLSGKVVPSAKLPFTIEKRWEDSPACGNYDETRKNGRCIIMKEYSWVIVDMTGNRLSRLSVWIRFVLYFVRVFGFAVDGNRQEEQVGCTLFQYNEYGRL